MNPYTAATAVSRLAVLAIAKHLGLLGSLSTLFRRRSRHSSRIFEWYAVHAYELRRSTRVQFWSAD
jgi:hypothetical protein